MRLFQLKEKNRTILIHESATSHIKNTQIPNPFYLYAVISVYTQFLYLFISIYLFYILYIFYFIFIYIYIYLYFYLYAVMPTYHICWMSLSMISNNSLKTCFPLEFRAVQLFAYSYLLLLYFLCVWEIFHIFVLDETLNIVISKSSNYYRFWRKYFCSCCLFVCLFNGGVMYVLYTYEFLLLLAFFLTRYILSIQSCIA